MTNFAGGAGLPAGTYRISYVTGALRYGPSFNFSVNFDVNYFYYITAGGADFNPAPGLTTQYASQAACQAANAGLFVDVVISAGTVLGVRLLDGAYGDNIAGSPNPTFLLTRLC